MRPIDVVAEFDSFLAARNKNFVAIVLGGAALNLLNIIDRETQDVDILDPEIPLDILNAALDFVKHKRNQGVQLRPDWLNHGAIAFQHHLPSEWKTRIQKIYSGKALTLYSLGHSDLLKTKLRALCERGVAHLDKKDCLAMKPSKKELMEAMKWLKKLKPDHEWKKHVERTLADLTGELNLGS